MKIEFVNHASFVIEHDGVRLICDPWLEGSVFNNGWSHIAPTKFRYEDFGQIDYIWFSHEHPDHFFPPNILKIPQEFRSRITVLFQETLDKRVMDFCLKKGFRDVVELKPDTWLELSDDFMVLNEHFQEGDSWICFKGGGLTYLNLNDCEVRTPAESNLIKSKVGEVDVLMSQFSYAYWAGNPEDTEYRQKKANEKLEILEFQVGAFRPKVTIPIASFVYFSHEENAFLNDRINTVDKAYAFLESNTDTTPVVLYPEDQYTFGEAHDSRASIAKYLADLDRALHAVAYTKTENVDPSVLREAANAFVQELRKNNAFHLKMLLKPAHVFVKDYGKAYSLSLNGWVETEMPEMDCDVSITSENLMFCIKFPYGLDTTQINGRFYKPANGRYDRFYNLFRVNQLKSRGINPNSMAYLAAVLKRRLLVRLGLRYT